MKKEKDSKGLSGEVRFARLENSSTFIPVSFVIILIAFVYLFKEFIFSNQIFYSGDLVQAGFFFRSFFVNYVKANGAVPHWDPYIFGGLPFVDAFHGDIFYPLSSLKFFGPLFRSLCYTLILHIYLSGIFTYFCARQMKLSKIAALMSAIAYMFSSYLISLIAPFHDGKIFVTSLFPLSILFLERGFEKKSFLNFSIYGLIIGLIILTPHAQLAYFTLWANAFYSIFKLICLYIKSRSIKTAAIKSLFPVYGVIVGLAISAIQFYSGYHYTQNYSPRSEAKKGWQWSTSWSLHEEEAFSLIIPEFTGTNTTGAKTYYWGKNPFKDNSETAEIVSMFLALIGLVCYRKKESYFFGGLALFSLIYALGANTPFFKLFYYLIPMVRSLRAPSMIMFLFVFSIAILAGMGLQYMLDLKTSKQSRALRTIIFGAPLFMLALALVFGLAGHGALKLWSSIFYKDAATVMVQQDISKFDVAIMNLPAIQSGAWFGFLFVALAAICLWLLRNRKPGILLVPALLLIPIVNSLRFNDRFISVFDYHPYIQSNPIVNFLKNDKSIYRVHDFTQNPKLNLAYHGVELVTGYHGNQLKSYDHLLGGPSQRNITNSRLLNLTGAKYLILPQNQRMPEGYLGPKPVLKVQDFLGGQLIRNDNAFPRTFLADSAIILTDTEQLLSAVLRGSEDLRKIVYLEERPELELSEGIQGSDSAWIISNAVDSVAVGVSNKNNRILILTNNFYESWKAYIDGVPGRLLRAYGSFMAVAIPAGTQTVLFKYKSERYKIGKTVTLTALFYLLAVFGYFLIRQVIIRIKSK